MLSTTVEQLVGRYSEKPEHLEKLQTDFGKIAKGNAIGCLYPKTIEDIQHIVRACNKKNIPIITRGMSHSASGQCLVQDGVVINIKTFNRVVAIQFDGKTGFVEVEAGITWEKLVKVTLGVGATPPTLTDWQKLTVGGSISTGGLGFMSYKSGVQADNVIELEVIIASGERVRCSATKNADLFNLVRAGLGQFGVIVKVKMKLERAPINMHVFTAIVPTTSDFNQLCETWTKEGEFSCIHSFMVSNKLEDYKKKMGADVVENNMDYFKSLLNNGERFSYFVELVRYEYEGEAFKLSKADFGYLTHYEKDDYFDYVTKEPPLIKTEKERGKTAHPELAVFIAKSQFESFMNAFLTFHRAEDMSDGPVLCIPMTNKQISTPLFVHPEEDFYFIGILRNAYPNTKERIAFLTGLNDIIYDIALAHDGNRYPVDSMIRPANKMAWKAHYGSAWKKIKKGKKKYDPEHRFQSLLNMFGD